MYSPIETLIYGTLLIGVVCFALRCGFLLDKMQARKEHRTLHCYYCKNREGVCRAKNCTNMHCKFCSYSER